PTATDRSAYRALDGATRAEPGQARRRNIYLPTRAGVAPVAGGALGEHERAESGERDATATPERLDHAADHGLDGALRSDLRAPGALRHDRHEVGLGHPSF